MSELLGRSPELLLNLADQPAGSLRHRLRDAIKAAIRTDRLRPGDRLPSTRTLAVELGVSRGVVIDAYAQLTEEGFLQSRQGSATTVAEGTAVADTATGLDNDIDGGPAYGLRSATVDLRPGPPDLSMFPRATWATATREVLRSLPDSELGYVTPHGCAALRAELAAHLSRARGAMASPRDVTIVSGATQGLTLTAKVLRDAGHRQLAVESPSNAVQRQVLGRYGLHIVDVAVDDGGLDVEALRRTSARAVLVTPAHQYPCGVVLAPARRTALIRWSEEVDGTIIEDDYDAEFRYDREPVGCLQGLAPKCVVLVGSVSKTLAPGLRLGWVVAPPMQQPAIAAAKRDDDFGSGVLAQHVLARLLDNGGYDRQVRRMRRIYRQRRDDLLRALSHELPDWTVMGASAGLHVMVRLPPNLDETELVVTASDLGIAVQGARSMYGALDPPWGALVIGYARPVLGGGIFDVVARLRKAAQIIKAPASQEGTRREAAAEPRATALDYF